MQNLWPGQTYAKILSVTLTEESNVKVAKIQENWRLGKKVKT